VSQGVYDNGEVDYLSCARGSYIPCSSGGIHRGVRGVLRVRIRCAITLISLLSIVVLWPGDASFDPLKDLAYGGLHDPVCGLYGD
jgi:hypothetical protein